MSNRVKVKSDGLKAVMVAVMISFVSGCSWTSGDLNHAIVTQVQLNQANFTVVKSMVGTAKASYYFGVGPAEQDLIGQAKRDLITKAQLKGSQAVVNVTTDIMHSGFFFWSEKKAYVSAEVVEFK